MSPGTFDGGKAVVDGGAAEDCVAATPVGDKRRARAWEGAETSRLPSGMICGAPGRLLVDGDAADPRDDGGGGETARSGRDAGEQKGTGKDSEDETAARLASLPCYEAPGVILVYGSAAIPKNSGGGGTGHTKQMQRR